jgi:hypothetical protein
MKMKIDAKFAQHDRQQYISARFDPETTPKAGLVPGIANMLVDAWGQ